jgi:hypothetical protein
MVKIAYCYDFAKKPEFETHSRPLAGQTSIHFFEGVNAILSPGKITI